jgi:hypothetical protein
MYRGGLLGEGSEGKQEKTSDFFELHFGLRESGCPDADDDRPL